MFDHSPKYLNKIFNLNKQDTEVLNNYVGKIKNTPLKLKIYPVAILGSYLRDATAAPCRK